MYTPGASITISNAKAKVEAGIEAIGKQQLQFDLSGVTTFDSSAVVVLLAWQRAAEGKGQKLQLTGVPEGLSGLATLYGVTSLLGLPSPSA